MQEVELTPGAMVPGGQAVQLVAEEEDEKNPACCHWALGLEEI
jgi:hypothetical protein